jgi:hypothetical protein
MPAEAASKPEGCCLQGGVGELGRGASASITHTWAEAELLFAKKLSSGADQPNRRDRLIMRCSRFRKSRLVPLRKTTTEARLEQCVKRLRGFTALDDNVFVSLRRRRLLLHDAEPVSIASPVSMSRHAGFCIPYPEERFFASRP